MSNQSRAELVSVLRNEYKVAPTRRDKSALVERCISVTGYSRKHALKLLNEKDRHEKLVPKRNTSLDHEAREALVLAWEVSRHICGKRLVHMLPEIVENMTRFGHWRFSKQAQTQLLSVSAATIDRALKEERLRAPRSLSTTKRAALVKKQVPVKTFAEWSDVIPGFFEIDTVSHCSSDPNGPFLYSLNMTDVATTWTVPIGLYRKTAKDVIGAFKKVQLPFPLKGVDFDNGSEFLNQDFIDWCKENKVTYTRSRPYKKNDQCFVEEKNGSVIRKNVGRERYVGLKAFRKLCELYGVLDDYFNFFVPCQKLLFKKRNGAKCYKKHDAAKTPYDRVLESAHVSDSCKEALKARKESLDMFSLFQKLQKVEKELKELAVGMPSPVLAAAMAQRNATYKFSTRKENTGDGLSIPAKLRQIIGDLPPGTMFEIKTIQLDCSRSSMDQSFHVLTKEGVIERISRGLYKVPVSEITVACPATVATAEMAAKATIPAAV